MKRLGIVLAASTACGALAAAGILGACSSDDFTSPDSGTDATDAQRDVAPTDAGEGGATDGGPKTWCQEHTPPGAACADFDTVDAASALAPAWGNVELGAGKLGVLGAGVSQNAEITSVPSQLLSRIGPRQDGGVNAVALLSVNGVANPTSVVLEFSMLPPPVGGANNYQRVEFASVAVAAPVGGLYLGIQQEGSVATNWQLHGNLPNPILNPIAFVLTTGTWHRIVLSLDKKAMSYQLGIDGKVNQAGNLNAWPANPVGSSGGVGGVEVAPADTTQDAYFDNVVFTSK